MRRLLYILILVLLVVIIGIFGFSYIEGWSFLDALYMTIITLTTTGFEEVYPLSSSGRIFTISLLVLGLFIVAFAVTMLSKMIVEGEFKQIYGRKRLDKILKKIKSHVIICGYGKMGRSIAKGFAEAGYPFVVIENDEKICEELLECEYLYVKGDAKSNDALLRAGIDRAKDIIPVMDDASNLFVTITARSINDKINIISKINEEDNKNKFVQVGANKVISPYSLSSTRIVQSVLNPAVEVFHEIASADDRVEFQIAELTIDNESKFKGKSIIDSKIRQYGVIVIGIKKQDGTLVFPPESDMILEVGDVLISIGKREGINKLVITAGKEK